MRQDRHHPYSILELAAVNQDCSVEETFEKSLQLARHAEQWGYHRFWLAEHHNMISIASSATAVLIGYIAAGTSRIRVGSGGIMLPNHAPLIVAEQFGTLARLHPGRIDLGLGRAPGTDQVTAQAIRSDRMQSVYRFPEEIAEIQQFFSEDNAGARVRVPLAEGISIPIYILGSSTDSARLAASRGLPYAFASHFAPAQLHEALHLYRSRFEPSSYLQEPYVIGCVNVIAAETDEKAEMLSTSLIRMILGVLTGNMDYMQPPVPMDQELQALADHPAIQRMLEYTFTGSRETVAAGISSFLRNTGVDEIMAVSHIYNQEDRLNSYHILSEVMKQDLSN